MMIYGEDKTIARWVEKLIPHVHTGFGDCVAMGYANDQGRLLAGFVYNNYSKEFRTICLSAASVSRMWARPDVIHEVFQYPFEQLGVYKVVNVTPADNLPAIKVNAHIGFKREAILAHHFGKGRHAVVQRLLQPDYIRLFGERYGLGKKQFITSADDCKPQYSGERASQL